MIRGAAQGTITRLLKVQEWPLVLCTKQMYKSINSSWKRSLIGNDQDSEQHGQIQILKDRHLIN